MSSHADTIRGVLEARQWVGKYRNDPGVPAALAALDALLAENQRLREENGFGAMWITKLEAETQRLHGVLKACDVALNWNEQRIIPTHQVPDQATANRKAREALAGDAG